MTTKRKFDWREVKVGDAFTVKRSSFVRGGMTGYVVSGPYSGNPYTDANGVSLDFFCDVFGDPKGLPSIEHWDWTELEIDG